VIGPITLSVSPALSGIIFDGTVLGNEFFIAHEGVEQVRLQAQLRLGARTQVGSNPATTTTLNVFLWGHGSITHTDQIEVTGWVVVTDSGPFNFPLGPDYIFADGVFSLHCDGFSFTINLLICDLSIDFDGSSEEFGLPISGTIVINLLVTSLEDSGTGFFSMEEFERMIITDEDDSVTLEGGILSVGPIVKASITDMDFGGDRHSYSLGGIESFDPMVIEGTASGTTIAGIPIPPGEEADFTITLNQPVTLDVLSFVVPLQDMSNDDRELDDRLFGGYDDFALTGTGMVYITAWVHDIAFKPVDNMGNTLPASNTAVTLIRYNGGPITRGSGSNPDQFQSNLAWSYSQWAGAETGYAIFYQLPGDQAYGVTVTFDNRPVYDEPFEIEKLTETVIAKLVTQVYKLKLVVIDCNGTTVPEAWIKYVEPGGRTVTTRIDSHGALDFGLIGGGEITVKGIWWKGVWIGFDKATIGSTELPVAADGSVKITIDRNIDSPVVLRAVINDFIFTTWDFNKDNRIPRLNITLEWVGEHPLTGKRIYFVETMDPTGDTNTDPFNTTVVFSQLLKYNITHLYKVGERARGLKTYDKVEYIFSKMPPKLYNITVTTVPGGDPDKRQTPGSAKWPGRTDAAVDYEIKIDWTSHDKAPTVRKKPAGQVNDRVVLRVYMTWNGQPVTDPDLNPFYPDNPTNYTLCGSIKIDLLTWAHTFWQRIVDGDFDYLREARRIGNATYHIVNDNGRLMEQYVPEERVFTSDITSRWTEDTLLTTWLKAASQPSSIIWWNGTYRKQDLVFLSYVYPLQFTRGEQPWARFYDKIGLTGTGWATTEEADTDDHEPGDDFRRAFLVDRFFNITAYRVNYNDPAHDIVRMHNQNGTWWSHNFTVVGTEGLWNQQKWRWEYALNYRDANGVPKPLVPEIPWKPYSLVIERPAQQLVPVSEKGVLTVPIPVGFITLNLKDEDLARAIPYAVVQLDIYSRGVTVTGGGEFCDATRIVSTTASVAAEALAFISDVYGGGVITFDEENVLEHDIAVYISDGVISNDEAEALANLLNTLTDGDFAGLDPLDSSSDRPRLVAFLKTFIQFIYVNILCTDDTEGFLDDIEIDDLIDIVEGTLGPLAPGDESDLADILADADVITSTPPEVSTTTVRVAGYKYKTGRDGNLTLLYPTQEAMENFLDAPVKNYTLTVYWYLNSSIVYKDAFNLTKRGYNVDQSRHSRRNIRPSNISRQRQTSQRPLRQNMVVQRNRRHNNLPR
jgi:hypothetical protein